MAGAVLRHVEDEEQKENSAEHVAQGLNLERPRVAVVEIHRVNMNPQRQRKEAHSYAKIYTRHVLAALVGRDLEERLQRSRDSQREDRSIEYSPTSPADDDEERGDGGTGLPTGRQVLALTSRGRHDPVPDGEIEWILDSGAQINVTGELPLLNNVKQLQHVELFESATGTLDRVEITGSVLMPVVNGHNGQVETRLLEDVRYSSGTKINLISQTCMQFECGYKLSVSDDQLVTWLVKPNLKMKFVLRDGLYHMRVKRHNKHVLNVPQRSDEASVMELLHNRFNHVSMDTIKQMVADTVGFGVKVNTSALKIYECVPCIESKIKRISYRRNPRRASTPLEKVSVDICSIDEVAADKSTMFLLVVDEFSRYKWTYLLQSKADASKHIEHLILKLEKHFKNREVVVFHADGGGEFGSNAFKLFCADHGVEMQFTHADSPEENGIVERASGVVVSRVHAGCYSPAQYALG